MRSGVTTETMRIVGMTCQNCQKRIEKKLRSTAGIEDARVSYNAGTATVTYYTEVISSGEIAASIRELGYEALTGDLPETAFGANRSVGTSRAVGAVLLIGALYLLMRQLGVARIFGGFTLAEAGMGYGMLFVVGLLTSVHCVAMCGGLNLSQCIPPAASGTGSGLPDALRPAFLYNLGRVISYTAVGAVVGALGSALSLSGAFKGVVQLIAGVFMVLMGLNMLGIFPWLRRLVPRMPGFFADSMNAEKGAGKSPLYVGLLNGLMPCGPLQAMQLYALSTGSASAGALSMLVFSLGTVPLMFGLGALGSMLSKRFAGKMMTAGAVLVAALGLSMFAQGLSLSGAPGLLPAGVSQNAAVPEIVIEDGVQIVNSTLASGRYPEITVQAGIPVRWIIDAPQGSVNGCNNRVLIPAYGIEYSFKTGENIIEFTPGESGKYSYSCWMGMIRSSIIVTNTDSATL